MFTRIIEYIKLRKYVLVFCVIFFLIRLPLLNQIYLLHDERDIVLTGYSVAKTGTDLYGNAWPLNFTGISPKNPAGAIYYSALWWKILPTRSVFNARLPFVFISTFILLLTYELILLLSKRKKAALYTSLIFCFSPWLFHLTRLALEINLAFVILLIGMLLFLKNRAILSYLFLLVACYTYLGFRALVPLLLIYLEFFLFFKEKRIVNIKRVVLSVIFIVVLFGSYFYIDKATMIDRIQNETILSKNEQVAVDVHFKRMTSVASQKLQWLFHNKLTSTSDLVLTNVLNGFDIQYLFKKGDYSPINGNTSSGQFFFPFIIFYLFGLAYIGYYRKNTDFFIAGFTFVGLVPSLINANSATYSVRAILTGIGFAYIMALGAHYLFDQIKHSSLTFKRSLLIIFILLMSVNVIYFGYNYFYRRPKTVGELFYERERQLALFLLRNSEKNFTVYHKFPNEVYSSFVLLNNDIEIDTVRIDGTNKKSQFWSKITFKNCDINKDFIDKKQTVIFGDCLSNEKYSNYKDKRNIIDTIPYADYSDRIAYFIFE